MPAAARTLKTRKLNDMTRMALTPKEPSRLLCSTYVELHNGRVCHILSKKYVAFFWENAKYDLKYKILISL